MLNFMDSDAVALWEFVQIWNPQKFFVSLCSD